MASTASFPPLGSNKEQGGDEWSVVIKVKYGDTLRRFSARVHLLAYVGQPLMFIEYDMNQLRAKISSLFMFSNDVALVLTYTDEDGDVVCLDSDDELRDAVIIQRLNPLRINVQIKSYSTEGSNSSSKPVKGSDIKSDTANPVNNMFPQLANELNSAVNKSLKSLPEPICGVLSNISHDMIKTVSSAPVFSELVSILSKMQLTNVSQSSHEPIGKSMGTSCEASSSAVNLNASDEPKVSDFVSPIPENIQKTNCDGKSVKPHQASMSNEQKSDCKVQHDRKSVVDAELHQILFGSQSDVSGNSQGAPTAISYPPILHPYKRSSSFLNPIPRTFHRGVICDGCGMHPIMGPRYKSTVKENYDLCGTCFRDMGREPEYRRIESAFRFPKGKRDHHKHHHRNRSLSPIVSHNWMKAIVPKLESSFIVDVTVWDGTVMLPKSHFTKIWRMRNTGTVAWPSGTQLKWVGGDHLGTPATIELEIPEIGLPVEFELDIAVDCVAPSALGKYVSYWQMASSSGQTFGEEVWVIIQVCDLQPTSACSTPTFINLNLPPESNQQSDPVIINVDSVPLGCVPADSDKLLEEFLKPAALDTLNSELENIITDSFASSFPEIPPSTFPVLNPAIDTPAASPVSFPAIDISTASPVSYPAIDIPTASPVSYPFIDISSLSNLPEINFTVPDDLTDENVVELTLLRELEEMGFMQTDLNKDILRLNQYDLEQSVEELCVFAEWDPLLKELQDMGFNDRELNMKLLVKNEGSIKRVVMELVTGETK